MDSIVLDQIPFKVDFPRLLNMVHLEESGEDADTVRRLVSEAEAIARPKAIFKVAYIDSKGDDHVVVDGMKLTSRVMRVNLDTAQRVFAFVATAGMELETWAGAKDDILEKYWAEAIMMQAVAAARAFLGAHLQDRYRPGLLSRMNPGSLQDWPLREQRPLFKLIGDTETSIGVRLTDSYLMIPRKSVSGIQFPTQESFESCQLCGREVCPNRRAPYDAMLFERKYSQTAQ